MSGLLLLIPIALALGLGGLACFLWALRSGQFDDLDGAAGRILFDDPPQHPASPAPSSPQPSGRLP
jgi:cbb3-type cytochrome oxidase maturation protein